MTPASGCVRAWCVAGDAPAAAQFVTDWLYAARAGARSGCYQARSNFSPRILRCCATPARHGGYPAAGLLLVISGHVVCALRALFITWAGKARTRYAELQRWTLGE